MNPLNDITKKFKDISIKVKEQSEEDRKMLHTKLDNIACMVNEIHNRLDKMEKK